jgi:DNA-binding GntR family transcriptional regulator
MATTASDRVTSGIIQALEEQRLVPGQRLIETDLATQFGVGRNAVREAIQRLAAQGVVDLSPNRSPSIRTLTPEERIEVLEVMEPMMGLLGRTAARAFQKPLHLSRMKKVIADLDECAKTNDPALFSHARQNFYSTLLEIGGNRELARFFSTIHMQVIYLQYQSTRFQEMRISEYSKICKAVIAGDIKEAETVAKKFVQTSRTLIIQSLQTSARTAAVAV